MSERRKYPKPSDLPGRIGSRSLGEWANTLEHAMSGDLIRELQSRGYRVFPDPRVVERDDGWFVKATAGELKRRATAQLRKQ